MNIKSHINKSVADFVSWRRHRHARPELAYKEEETAAFLAAKLRGFGLEVKEGIGGTGVVGVLRRGNGPMVALRADMDALPITEATGLPYASQNAGVMHACGHDGHTAMLLGAAQILAETPPANGTIVFIFQPAEEGEAGGKAMIEDGLFRDFPVACVYGLHNWPGIPAGQFAVRAGTVMAAFDTFEPPSAVASGLSGEAYRHARPPPPTRSGQKEFRYNEPAAARPKARADSRRASRVRAKG